MPRWLRVIRGMIGTGLTFGVSVGVVSSLIGGLLWLGGELTARELLQMAGKLSVVSFLLGLGFSAVLAITARGQLFNKISLRRVSAIGAGAGLLYFGIIARNGIHSWSLKDAIANFIVLPVMGAGLAVATLLIARRAGSTLGSGEETQSLNAGDGEFMGRRNDSKVEVSGR